VSGRVALDTSTAIHAGDIEVNGVSLGGYNGASTDSDSIGTTDNNIADFVDLVNDADAGVTASAFNTVVASTVGTGIVAADELSIQVGAVGNNPVVEQVIGASTNMDELVANINLAMGGAVAASTDSAGRLVLSNSTGASISVTELSGTSGATDTGSGFQDEGGTISVYTGATTNTFNGFLRFESTNGEDITIMRGNAGLASPGSLTDLAEVGFREVSESPEGQPYSVTGIALTSGGVASAIGNNELTINGIEIYEESLSSASTSFQGKLDLINAFTTETDVIASAYFEKSFDFSNVTYVTGQTFDINGTGITMAGDLATTVANINAATGTTGVTATVNGNNVVLKGNNVQQVTIGNYEYDLDDDFEAHVAGKKSLVFGEGHRTHN
jgi:flagellin